MPILKSVDNHKALTLSNDVAQICQPLFDNFPINYFNYVRIYDDQRRLSLGNNADWLEHYFNQQYQNFAVFQNIPEVYKNPAYLWDGTFNANPVMNIAAEQFDIDHGFSFVEKQADYCEFFHFAAKKVDTHVNNVYCNHYDALKLFTLYFKQRAQQLFKITRPCIPVENEDTLILKTIIPDYSRKKFLKEIRLNSYTIVCKQGPIELSRRLFQCLILIGNNKTTKEIAKILNLSNRTIEHYIELLKQKLNCYSKTALGEIYISNKLFIHLDLVNQV